MKFRHVIRVSRDAAREVTRDYPSSSQYDSVTFTEGQVRGMSDRARLRGNAAVADEFANAAEEATKTVTDEVAFLKFFDADR
jgi:hypothetical protein